MEKRLERYEPKKYNEEDARYEAQKLKTRVEGGEASDYAQAEQIDSREVLRKAADNITKDFNSDPDEFEYYLNKDERSASSINHEIFGFRDIDRAIWFMEGDEVFAETNKSFEKIEENLNEKITRYAKRNDPASAKGAMSSGGTVREHYRKGIKELIMSTDRILRHIAETFLERHVTPANMEQFADSKMIKYVSRDALKRKINTHEGPNAFDKRIINEISKKFEQDDLSQIIRKEEIVVQKLSEEIKQVQERIEEGKRRLELTKEKDYSGSSFSVLRFIEDTGFRNLDLHKKIEDEWEKQGLYERVSWRRE